MCRMWGSNSGLLACQVDTLPIELPHPTEAERSYHFDHWLHVSKKSSALWFYAHFFMILYMCIALGRGRQPIRARIFMSTGRPHHFGHLLQVSNKSLQPLTLYTSFHDLINVYSRRSCADNPQGTKFWCQQKPLVTSVICYKFKTNLFEVLFDTHFFMNLYMYIAQGHRWRSLGDRILMSTGTSRHFSHLLQVAKKSLEVLFYSWFYTFI